MPAGLFCDTCGKQNREHAQFCGYCGEKLQVEKQSNHKNKSFFRLLLPIITLLAGIGIGFEAGKRTEQKGISITQLHKASAKPQGMDSVAHTKVEEALKSKMVKCGNSWFTKKAGRHYVIYEIKELSIILKPAVVTRADRANGIQWKGSFYINAPYRYRYYYPSKENQKNWIQWSDGGPGMFLGIVGNNVGYVKIKNDLLEMPDLSLIEKPDYTCP